MKKYMFRIFIAMILFFEFLPINVLADTDTKYMVNVFVKHNDNGLPGADIVISQNGEEVNSATTNKNGSISFELTDGTYTATVNYVRGDYSYCGTTEFTVNGENTMVVLEVDREMTYSSAKEKYDDTEYYDHVDIRVNGSFTVGPANNLVTYNIKLRNVRLLVKDGDTTLINTTFTDNDEDYEWRVTEQSIPNTAVVSLIFDIVLDGKVVRRDFSTSFSGEAAFIQAIINCDMNQGLDFILLPTEIISAALYDVSYVWTGLPSGLASVPETSEHALDYVYTIDTQFKSGDVIIDNVNNKKYTFSGWEEWSNATDNHVTKNDIGANTTITIINDTIIYGRWEETDLVPTSNYIVINKSFSGNDGKLPQDLLFKITDLTTSQVYEVGIDEFTLDNVTGIYSYRFPVYEVGTYKIEELNYVLSGYTFSINNVTVQEVATDLTKEEFVTFNNAYTKNSGLDLHNSKFIVEKVDASNGGLLSGAVFTLTNQLGEIVATATTDDFGYVTFMNLKEGTYILKETSAPNGYHLSETEYGVVVTCINSYEVYSAIQNAYVMQYEYSVVVTPNEDYNTDDNRLTVYNEKIFGSITISKEFGINSNYDKSNYSGDIKVLITGVNDYNNTIILNKSNNFSITLDNLELGQYTITEIVDSAKIDGYTLDTVYNKSEITLTDTSYVDEIIITNTYTKIPENIYKETSFSVKKADENGNLLEGAIFGLYDADDKLIESKSTDKFGIVTFGGFKETATYVLKEISAPSNYHKVDTEWVVNIVLENDKPSFENGDYIYNFVVVIDDDSYSNNELTVVNEIMTGNIVVKKEVTLTSRGETVSKPESVKDVKYSFTVVIGSDIYNIELCDGESKTFENIPFGTEYKIVENIPVDATWIHTAPVNANGIVLEEKIEVEMENIYVINNGNGEDPDDGNDEDLEKDNNVPQTGVSDNIYNNLFITLIGIVGLIFTIFKYRKEI